MVCGTLRPPPQGKYSRPSSPQLPVIALALIPTPEEMERSPSPDEDAGGQGRARGRCYRKVCLAAYPDLRRYATFERPQFEVSSLAFPSGTFVQLLGASSWLPTSPLCRSSCSSCAAGNGGMMLGASPILPTCIQAIEADPMPLVGWGGGGVKLG